MDDHHVALQVPQAVEVVGADLADVILAFVDAPDVVDQFRLPFEPPAADFAAMRGLLLVDQLNVGMKAMARGEGLSAEVANMGTPSFMHHLHVVGQGGLGHGAVAALMALMRFLVLMNALKVPDQRGLLSGLVVAQMTLVRFLVLMDNSLMDLHGLVRRKLLPARLANEPFLPTMITHQMLEIISPICGLKVAQLASDLHFHLAVHLGQMMIQMFSIQCNKCAMSALEPGHLVGGEVVAGICVKEVDVVLQVAHGSGFVSACLAVKGGRVVLDHVV